MPGNSRMNGMERFGQSLLVQRAGFAGVGDRNASQNGKRWEVLLFRTKRMSHFSSRRLPARGGGGKAQRRGLGVAMSRPLRVSWRQMFMGLLVGLAASASASLHAADKPPATRPSPAEPSVRAVDFESRKVCQSSQHPGYTSWVSFFPGERGQWYIGCGRSLTAASSAALHDSAVVRDVAAQWLRQVGLPHGDGPTGINGRPQDLARDLARTGAISAQRGSFAQARTKDGRFLRFVWSCYSLDPSVKPNEIYYESGDNGKTWIKMPTFVDPHFAAQSNRLRTLHDGTLVLALPLSPDGVREPTGRSGPPCGSTRPTTSR